MSGSEKEPGASSDDIVFDVPPKGVKESHEAKKEASKFARDEAAEDARHRIYLVLLWSIGILAVIALAIRAYHLLLPQHLRWLDAEDIESIDNVLGGALGALLVAQINRLAKR